MSESDKLIDLLLNDIHFFENLETGSSEGEDLLLTNMGEASYSFSSSSTDKPHVIFAKKRKYQWQKDSNKDRKVQVHYDRYQKIIFPRIMKHDIRRKYAQMYTNITNSYDYDLIASFFQTFSTPNLLFEIRSQHSSYMQMEGIEEAAKYFMLHLQVTPDRVTNISDVHLKQSLKNVGKTEVSFNFRSSNTFLYDIFPNKFKELMVDTPRIYSPPQRETTYDSRKRKTILDGFDSFSLSESEKARALFDPVYGMFLKSKFERLENPISFHIEGSMTIMVNEENLIESIVMGNVRKIGLVGYSSHL